MPSTRFDLNITQGSSFEISIIVDDDIGDLIDLTGHTAYGRVKFRYGDADPIFYLTPTIPASTATQGIVKIDISQDDTKAYPVFQGVYEVEIIKGDFGLKTIYGLINVIPQVTT